ncbi:MAG TPA: hypothetical protein VGB50_05975 [Flavobacterium sp.]|jgi:hypothetical protein
MRLFLLSAAIPSTVNLFSMQLQELPAVALSVQEKMLSRVQEISAPIRGEAGPEI